MLLTRSVQSYAVVQHLKSCVVGAPVLKRKLSSNFDQNARKSSQKYDIIIAGGGMVGCTLACALGKKPIFSNLKILLLEGSPNIEFNVNKPEYSNRVVALNPSTRSLMESIDAWQHIENVRVQPVRHMQVWDASSDGLITFSSSDIDGDVAYIIENDLVLHSVKKELDKAQNVEIVYQSKINGYDLAKDETNNLNIVKMSNGDTYCCDLLIGADGAKSKVREAMGVQYISFDYDQMGIVSTLQLADGSENTTAWQRFLPTGPIALLPLNSTCSSLVWSTNVEDAKRLLALSDESFVDALNDALWKQYPSPPGVETASRLLCGWLRRLGLPDGADRQLPPSVRGAGARAAFPLGFGHSTRYVARGTALVGDAAHRVHPLAGQGVNLGFGDVTDLTKLLADAVYAGLDISHPSHLSRYESVRQRHVVPTQLAVHALQRLYTNNSAPAVLLRTLGQQLTHAAAPLKKMIMDHAST